MTGGVLGAETEDCDCDAAAAGGHRREGREKAQASLSCRLFGPLALEFPVEGLL